jgi:hypothetical protein
MKKFSKLVEHDPADIDKDYDLYAHTCIEDNEINTLLIKVLPILEIVFGWNPMFLHRLRELRDQEQPIKKRPLNWRDIENNQKFEREPPFNRGLRELDIPHNWSWAYLPYGRPIYVVESISGLSVLGIYRRPTGLFIVVEFYHNEKDIYYNSTDSKWERLEGFGFEWEDVKLPNEVEEAFEPDWE